MAGVGGGGAAPGVDDKTKQLIQMLLSRATSPQDQLQKPGLRGSPASMVPGQMDMKGQPKTGRPDVDIGNSVNQAIGNFGTLIHNLGAQHKQQQVRDAMSEWDGISNAYARASLAAGDPSDPKYKEKLMEAMKADPWVKANLDPSNPRNVKRLKNMSKALNFDPLGDDQENVHRQGLLQHFKVQDALKKMIGARQKMDAQKQKAAQGQQQPGAQGAQQGGGQPQPQQLQDVLQRIMSQSRPQQADPKTLLEAQKNMSEAEHWKAMEAIAARDKYQIMPDKDGNIVAVDRTNPGMGAKPVHTVDGQQLQGKPISGEGKPVLVDGQPVGMIRGGKVVTPSSPEWTSADATKLDEFKAAHKTGEAEKDARIEKARSAWIWGYLNSRIYPTMKNGELGMATGAHIKGAPYGTYGPATQEMIALRQHATFDEIDVTSKGLEDVAKSAGDLAFTSESRAKLIAALMDTSMGPKAAVEQFLGSKVAESMPQPLQDYAVWLSAMQESAYALRSIQGLGASSDMMRSAIKKMVPSAGTPTYHYFQTQMKAFNAEMNALKRGIPKIDMNGLDRLAPASTGGVISDPSQVPDANK